MIICESPQGSPEWYQDRAGAITGSMFSEVRKRLKSGQNKGDFTNEAKKYAFELAIERVTGKALQDDQFETYAMKRGHFLEPDARAAHEARHGVMVIRAGFIKTDDGKFGCSADGLIDLRGGGISEYKCFVNPEKLSNIILENDWSEVRDQVQGGLWLTGRKWAHYGLYCPDLACVGLDLVVHEEDRDEAYIEELEQDLVVFDRLVEDYRCRILERAPIAPIVNAPEPEELESIF